MRVLVADDDKVNRVVLSRFLEKWGYEVVQAEDGTQAWDALQGDDAPRLVILDWMMPRMDGAEICRELRRRKDSFYTYVLLLTAKANKQELIEGLDAGADDYLTKPFDSNELRARLRAARRILDLHLELLRARDRLQFQACYDALTGIWNRAAILNTLQAELARSQRERGSVAVTLADLDQFKVVNDRYGHMVGDAVLREVSRRIRAQIRAYDAVGRYGGEEFLIVMPGIDATGATIQAERLRRAVSEKPIETAEGLITVTLSFGIAATADRASSDGDFLLRAADRALYRAKDLGRNRIEVAPDSVRAGLDAVPM